MYFNHFKRYIRIEISFFRISALFLIISSINFPYSNSPKREHNFE